MSVLNVIIPSTENNTISPAKIVDLAKKIDSLRKNIAQRIEVVGAVSPNELPAYYDRANVLISLAGCRIITNSC